MGISPEKHIEVLSSILSDRVELEWGAEFPLEFLEELRLTLKSFLTPKVLDAMLAIYKELDTDPKDSEIFSWFIGNSKDGVQCGYATMALVNFKRNRLDRTKKLLRKCLEELEGMK